MIDYENGKEVFLGHEKSKEIFQDLIKRDYIDESGNAKDKLKRDLDEGNLELAEEFKDIKEIIIKKLKSTTGKLVIKNADERKKITLNKEVFLSDEFKELWDKVKYKTTYQVNFNAEELIDKCIKNLDEGDKKTKDMKKLKKLWIKIISIVGELLANILLFHTPVKFKRFIFIFPDVPI